MHWQFKNEAPPYFNRPVVFGALLATVLTMAVLAILWEFALEERIINALGLPFDVHFETIERWRFVIASIIFATLSLTVPALFLAKAFSTLDRARRSLVVSRGEAEMLARHDPLTGLPNRRVFREDLQRHFAETQKGGAGFALLLIDLDWFKSVNDIHGHLCGDATLVEVARLLVEVMPPGTSLARLGGDEFGALMTDAGDPDRPGRMAERLVSEISRIRIVDGLAIRIGASIGIAVSPRDGIESRALLRAADAALYGAKETHGVVQFFQAGMGDKLWRDAALREDLRSALLNGDIVAHYQPLVRLNDRVIVGFEVLARWTHPQRGPIAPDIFIPIAEEAGLIGSLTALILAQACQDASSWPSHLTIAVNLSPRQLKQCGLANDILTILKAQDFPASRLELEVTETGLVQDIATAKHVISELKEAGASIVLDDFGTGYSSLYHLRELPFSKLKIDRSFIASLQDDESKRRLLVGILGLAHSLCIETTAEGVENAGDADWLGNNGCDFGQGYLFGKPMSAADAAAFLFRPRPPKLALVS
jgi:diguanylate cyclase (GGDEF)-like protein